MTGKIPGPSNIPLSQAPATELSFITDCIIIDCLTRLSRKKDSLTHLGCLMFWSCTFQMPQLRSKILLWRMSRGKRRRMQLPQKITPDFNFPLLDLRLVELVRNHWLICLGRIPNLKVCLFALHWNLPIKLTSGGVKKPPELSNYWTSPWVNTPWCSKWFCLCLFPQRHSKEGEQAACFQPMSCQLLMPH